MKNCKSKCGTINVNQFNERVNFVIFANQDTNPDPRLTSFNTTTRIEKILFADVGGTLDTTLIKIVDNRSDRQSTNTFICRYFKELEPYLRGGRLHITNIAKRSNIKYTYRVERYNHIDENKGGYIQLELTLLNTENLA